MPAYKRALSNRDDPPAKAAKVKATKKAPERYAYITVTTTKTTPFTYPAEENAVYGDAYESQEDAENALQQIANDDYAHVKWEVSTEHHLLRIYTNEGHYSNGYDYDDNGIKLKVEKFRLKPKGCVKRVELKRPRSLGD